MKKFLTLLGLCLWASSASAQVSVPNTFVAGDRILAADFNANFSALSNNSLNRGGGTVTGNINVDSGVTIDGVDIGAVLGGSGTPTFADITISDDLSVGDDANIVGDFTVNTNKFIVTPSTGNTTVAGTLTVGSGSVQLTTNDGKIQAISSTYFADLSGANLTNLTAANIASGTAAINISGNAATATALQTARTINGVSFDGTANITVTAAAGTLTGSTLSSGVTASSLTSVGTITSGTWSGSFGAVSGTNLTGLAKLASSNSFTARNEFRTYSETKTLLTISAGSLVVDLSAGTHFTVSANADATITFTNPQSTTGTAGSFSFAFTNDGTVRSFTWPAGVRWAAGAPYVPTGTSTKIDFVTCVYYDGAPTYYCTWNRNF